MSKYAYSQNNFIAGELSPKLRGRNDVQQYFSGLAKLENFIPFASGGIGSRPGTVFGLDTTSWGGQLDQLIFFKYENDSFLIVIKTAEIRIYRMSLDTVTADWQIQFTQVTVNEGSNFRDPYIGGVTSVRDYTVAGSSIYLTDGLGPPFVISFIDRNTFRVNTYWDEVNVSDQTGSAILDPTVRGVPFPARNKQDSLTITPNAGHTQLTASQAIFDSKYINSYIRVKSGAAQENIYRIDSVASNPNTVATVTRVVNGGVGSGAYYEWAISSWYGDGQFTNEQNWPRSVAFYQNRLVWGGSPSYSDTVWCTETNNPLLLITYKLSQDSSSDVSGLRHFGGVLDTDPFEIVVGAGEVDVIKWITSDRSLQVGTDTVENFILPVDGIFGPKNFNIVPSTFFGSSDNKAIRYENSTYFVEVNGVRELSFSEEDGSNVSRLTSALFNFDDYPVSGLEVWRSKSSIVGISDNQLVLQTVNKSTQILAWSRHTFRDLNFVSSTVSVEVQGKKFLMLGMDRFSGSEFIEYMPEDFTGGSIPELFSSESDNYSVLDSCIIPAANPASGVISVPHLDDGTEVDVILAGKYDGRQTVSGGQVPVSDDTVLRTQILVGIPIDKKIETMPIEAGSRIGNSQIQIARIHEILLRLHRSKGGKQGSSSDKLDDINYENLGDSELFTGDIKICFDSNPDLQQVVVIESDEPYPLNILSIGMEGVTED